MSLRILILLAAFGFGAQPALAQEEGGDEAVESGVEAGADAGTEDAEEVAGGAAGSEHRPAGVAEAS